MDADRVQKILKKIHTLPALPAAVEQLCRLADDLDADIRDLTRAVSGDEALTARILRVANSAFYGLSFRISTVSQAIVVLGFQAVKNLALGVSVFGLDKGSRHELPVDRADFWRHSLAVASAARLLAMRLRLRCPEEAFSAGLLHDIGKVIFIEHFPREYAEILEQVAADAGALNTLERETFGMNHAAAGKHLCKHWKIPPTVVRAVAEHHHPSRPNGQPSKDDQLVPIVQVADNLAKIVQFGAGGDAHTDMGWLSLFSKKELHPQQMRQVLLALPEEVRKAEVFFDLPTAAETETTASRKPDPVALLLTDPLEEELVTMSLLCQGYALVSLEQAEDDGTALAGLVGDDSVPADVKERLEQQGVPLLDFARWKARDDGQPPKGVHILGLQAWLREGLPQPVSRGNP